MCRSTLKHLPIEIMTIICVLILFPLLMFAFLILAPFPTCIYPRVLLLLTSIFVSLTARFIIELYPRTSQWFDQAGNKSSVASKLLLHTYTWAQMVKAKERWGVRKKKRRKGKKTNEGGQAKETDGGRRSGEAPKGEGPLVQPTGNIKEPFRSSCAFEIFLLNELQAVADSSLAG